MVGPDKVRVQLGDALFEAEGSEEAVDRRYQAFLDALKHKQEQRPAAEPAKENQQNNNDDVGKAADTADAAALLQRGFMNGEVVSLTALPRSESQQADSLVLLLYGYEKLKSQPMVLGTQLVKAARQSGLNIDRVDRAISAHDSLLLKGGARKGTRYGLNNQGKIKAMELLKALLE